jgi:DNA-binding NtrC family response regulator
MKNIVPSLRVLIVDDEEDMRWALKTIVFAEGHAGTVASSAAEALRLLAGASFQTAFVDVKLPDMEGLDLVDHIKRLAPNVACILISGYYYDADEAVQQSLKSGRIKAFIGKPFLLRQIQDALALAALPLPVRGIDGHGK